MSKSADAALAMAEAFFRLAPADKRRRPNEAQWAASLKKFHLEAKEIRHRYSLGFLAQAKAAYHFQQRLLAAGLEADTVRKVVFSLVLSSFAKDR